MKRFRVKMDACFEADDIVDAMQKLGAHFITVSDGDESNLLEPPSSIEIGIDHSEPPHD